MDDTTRVEFVDKFTTMQKASREELAAAGIEDAFAQRRYLPTLSDLVDRLSIVQMKAIFIHERKSDYMAEMRDILHDIDLILGGEAAAIRGKEIRTIIVLALVNRFIWENESFIRKGEEFGIGVEEIASRLKLTHSINGVRNSAKNELAVVDGGRRDFKVDALAASVIEKGFGDWDVFS